MQLKGCLLPNRYQKVLHDVRWNKPETLNRFVGDQQTSKPRKDNPVNTPNKTPTAACKDCRAAGINTRRPTPHPGPRCASHHRAHTKATKARNANRRIETTYGLTAEQYNAIYTFQGGRCTICQRSTGKTRRLAVDHDHQTGTIRGLLCKTCNTVVIGRYGIEALSRAIAYLVDPPAPRALGHTITVPEGATR